MGCLRGYALQQQQIVWLQKGTGKLERKHIFLGVVILIFVIIICIIIWKVSPQKTSAQRLPDKYQELMEKDENKKTIKGYTSAVDKDNDGKDDQTDILLEAIAYINTKPKYKSKYYNTGYPDDGSGVSAP